VLASSLSWRLCCCWLIHFPGVSDAAGFTLLASLHLLASYYIATLVSAHLPAFVGIPAVTWSNYCWALI
jgi:hypothetical protein